MRTLPTGMIRLLISFVPPFSERVWRRAIVLLAGAILAPGRRTVSSALRATGLDQEKRFHRYHRGLSRARWSSREVSRVLLGLLVEAFVPEGPLVVGIDHTGALGAILARHVVRASADETGRQVMGAFRQAAWYHKSHPTFVADALALVRKELWAQEETFRGSPADTEPVKVPRVFVERLTDALCYAA